jgi:hypothetical protein
MKTRELYIEEIPHKDKRRTIHKLILPELGEPKGYTSILAYDAFAHGARKGASKIDKEHHRGNCNWSPTSLFICKNKEELEMSFQGTLQADKRIGELDKEKFPNNPREKTLIEDYYGGNYQSLEEIPTMDHHDIKDFFKHIGFDQKARGYVDTEGKAIKYSIVTPKPKTEPAPKTKTTPEIGI